MTPPETHADYRARVMAKFDAHLVRCRMERQARERDDAARLEQLELAEDAGVDGVERDAGGGAVGAATARPTTATACAATPGWDGAEGGGG